MKIYIHHCVACPLLSQNAQGNCKTVLEFHRHTFPTDLSEPTSLIDGKDLNIMSPATAYIMMMIALACYY